MNGLEILLLLKVHKLVCHRFINICWQKTQQPCIRDTNRLLLKAKTAAGMAFCVGSLCPNPHSVTQQGLDFTCLYHVVNHWIAIPDLRKLSFYRLLTYLVVLLPERKRLCIILEFKQILPGRSRGLNLYHSRTSLRKHASKNL